MGRYITRNLVSHHLAHSLKKSLFSRHLKKASVTVWRLKSTHSVIERSYKPL